MASATTKGAIVSPGRDYLHCIDAMPYRSIVFVKFDHNKVALYQVAGCSEPPAGARKALERAFAKHGGQCFYCAEVLGEVTIDHVEPVAAGGTDSLQNLVIACKPCNAGKGRKVIELFNPEAGKEWLEGVLSQVEDRLKRLPR
jgi:5-methylcytosine-specific restriction endonuclease McrA